MGTELEQYYYHWMNIYKDCGQTWKQAAKINRKRFGVTVRDFLDAMKLLHKAEALAASRLKSLNAWKAKAKQHRDKYHTCHDSYMRLCDIYDNEKALAASRLELLRRCQELLNLSEKYIPGDLFYRDGGKLHDELAKELGDDNNYD